MKYNKEQAVYLAALLHDIGKFHQRSVSSQKELPESVREQIGSICPTFNNRHTHIHALHTYHFFAGHEEIFPGTIEDYKDSTLSYVSARHHKKNLSGLEKIVQFADSLSSGQDRASIINESSQTAYAYKKQRLLNPFDVVFDLREKDSRSYFPLSPLRRDGMIFAKRENDNSKSLEEEYALLWETFIEETKKLPSTSFVNQVNTLLYVLHKYTWCIPSDTSNLSDISLFDHLKTTAAIAHILFRSEEVLGETPSSFDGLCGENKNRFALFAGDFSGIQKFIYQISSKGAAKTLKGRSFYLNLIQDVVLTELKDLFGVFDAHILMNTGGKFQLLVPNDSGLLEEAAELVNRMNRTLLDEYDGILYLATGYHAFSANHFMAKKNTTSFSDVISKVYEAIERAKSTPFAAVADAVFFAPLPLKGASADQICQVTGIDCDDNSIVTENDLRISKPVQDQINLGRALKGARWIVKMKKDHAMKSLNEIKPFSYGKSEECFSGSHVYQIINNEDDLTAYKMLTDSIRRMPEEIIAFNDFEFMQGCESETKATFKFMNYGAAWIPEDGIEFTHLASTANRNQIDEADRQGENKIAILRMDVDNLGTLFQQGLKYEIDDLDHQGQKVSLDSISRYSNLSNSLERYFGVYIDHLISVDFHSQKFIPEYLTAGEFHLETPNHHILPIYAGGDDVFLITRWDLAPILAEKIYDDFKSFTNKHPKLSISAGISVVPPKFPIHTAANEAEKAEKGAKNLPKSPSEQTPGKDAISLFGQPMSWDDYKTIAKPFVQHLAKLKQEMATQTMLTFLRRLYFDYNPNYHFGRWRWRAAYQLKRISSTYKNSETAILDLGPALFTGRFKNNTPKRTLLLKQEHLKDTKSQRNPELVDFIGLALRWLQSLKK